MTDFDQIYSERGHGMGQNPTFSIDKINPQLQDDSSDRTNGTNDTEGTDGTDGKASAHVTRLDLSVPQSDGPMVRPKLIVLGVGGAGGNAVNNMIQANLQGVDFVVANTDAQSLNENLAPLKLQLGVGLTEGLGAGSDPETGRAAAEESIDELLAALEGAHMVFLTAGMGGGTGTGAAPEIAKELRACGILTVAVVTRPFEFEGLNRRRIADAGIQELEQNVDTIIVIPNQHLFRIASEKALFADAMKMADEVLYNGVRAISDLITSTGTWNLDFADVRTLMTGMGHAMMGTGEAEGEERAVKAAEIAISNPLLEDMDLRTTRGLLINISAGEDLTFYEVETAASRVKAEIPIDASIIVGQSNNPNLKGRLRVSIVATGLRHHQPTQSAHATEAIDASAPSTSAPTLTTGAGQSAQTPQAAHEPAPISVSAASAASAAASVSASMDQPVVASSPYGDQTLPPTRQGEPAPESSHMGAHWQQPVAAVTTATGMATTASETEESRSAATTSAASQPKSQSLPSGQHQLQTQPQPQNSAPDEPYTLGRATIAPPMPRHRDTQALNEMARQASPSNEPARQKVSPAIASVSPARSQSPTNSLSQSLAAPTQGQVQNQADAQDHSPQHPPYQGAALEPSLVEQATSPSYGVTDPVPLSRVEPRHPSGESERPSVEPTQPTAATMTAYEIALADAKRVAEASRLEAEQSQRETIRAYEREQVARQAEAEANARAFEASAHQQHPASRPHPTNHQSPRHATAESMGLPPALQGQVHPNDQPYGHHHQHPNQHLDQHPNQHPQGGQSGEPDGIFGRMRNFARKAARPQNRGNEQHQPLSKHGYVPSIDGPPNGPPNGPSGGHRAPLQNHYESSHEEQQFQEAMARQQAVSPPDLYRPEHSAEATAHRIRAITSPQVVDDSEDDLLMDIPAFLRRQYN